MTTATEKLTPKQALFVQEFLIDMNGTQAALRSGYSPRTANRIASENLSKPVIIDALQKAMAERSKRTQISADNVLKEFAKIGFVSISDIVTWGEDGKAMKVKASSELSTEVLSAIQEVSESTTKDGVRTVKVKLWDKLSALTPLARHLGLLPTNVKHSGGVDVNHHGDGQQTINADDAAAWLSALSKDELDSLILRFDLEQAIIDGRIQVFDEKIYAEFHIEPPPQAPDALPEPENAIDATYKVSDEINAGERA